MFYCLFINTSFADKLSVGVDGFLNCYSCSFSGLLQGHAVDRKISPCLTLVDKNAKVIHGTLSYTEHTTAEFRINEQVNVKTAFDTQFIERHKQGIIILY